MDDARRAFVDELNAFLEDNRNALQKILCDLIRAKTVNPPGDEHLAARLVCDAAARATVEATRHETQPGRTNVLLRLGRPTPLVLCAAHLDVVPPGEGWTGDPFEPRVEGDRVIGRGACDNKGIAAAMLALLPFLTAHADELAAGALFAFVADEERGSALGMEYLMREGLFDDVTAAWIPDSANHMRKIVVSEKGLLHLDVTAHGKAAHGSTPHLGSNAILHMMAFVRGIEDLGLDDAEHPLHSAATWNLGAIQGGEAPNIVPPTCTAQIDFRYLPNQSSKEILAAVRRLADEIAQREDDCAFDIEVADDLPPAASDEHSKLVATLAQATRDITGARPGIEGISGTTVAKQLLYRGIDAVGMSPGDPGVAHTADEWVSLDELSRFAAVLALLLYDFGR